MDYSTHTHQHVRIAFLIPPILLHPEKLRWQMEKTTMFMKIYLLYKNMVIFQTIVILVGQVTSMPQRIDAGKDLQTKKESSPIGIWKLLRETKNT